MAGSLAGAGSSPRGINHGGLESAKTGSGGPAKLDRRPVEKKSANRAGTAARDDSEESEDETYETWLTEDDMVWGAENNVPPTLLGTDHADDQGSESDQGPSASDGGVPPLT